MLSRNRNHLILQVVVIKICLVLSFSCKTSTNSSMSKSIPSSQMGKSEVEVMIERVLAEKGLTGLKVNFNAVELSEQRKFEGVLFEDALRDALEKFMTYSKGSEGPYNIATEDYQSEFCNDVKGKERVRRWMSNKCKPPKRSRDYATISLVYRDYKNIRDPKITSRPEDNKLVKDYWIFDLRMPMLSDHLYWAVVDRMGKRQTYVYGFN